MRVEVGGVIFIQNDHIYKYGHNRGQKWFPKHDSGAFDRKFDEKKDEIPPGIYRPHIFEIYQYWGVDG